MNSFCWHLVLKWFNKSKTRYFQINLIFRLKSVNSIKSVLWVVLWWMLIGSGWTGSTSLLLWEVHSFLWFLWEIAWFLDFIKMPMSTVQCLCLCFCSCTAKFWNALPGKCFPMTYNLKIFKSRVNRHLLSLGCF